MTDDLLAQAEAEPAPAASPAKPAKLTSLDVKQYLSDTYTEAEGYACCFEVPSGTGGNGGRYADAVILNLWPSRGMELVGYEIKVNRQDWLNELKQPEKAWPVMKYCDRWFLIATPGVAKVDELPTNWGFIEFNGTKATVRKAAPALKPEQISRTFLGAMLRKPIRDIERSIQAGVRKKEAELEQDIQRRVDQRVRTRAQEAERALEKIAQIKEETGIDLLHWAPPKEAIAALKFATAAEPFKAFAGYNSALSRVASAHKALQELQEQLTPFLSKEPQ